MPLHRLTVAKVKRLTEPGRYADGGCLFLVVTPSGAKQWVARLTIQGRQTDLGLGGASYVLLSEAREEAARLRKIARLGGDPRVERRAKSLTFADAARLVHEGLLPTWRNAKHAETWLATVVAHANPVIGDRSIDRVGTADILRVLAPIWTEKHETAKRLKQRLSTIFDWAKGAGHYSHENPVNGVQRALPYVKRVQHHMAALPWQEIPQFMTDVGKRVGVSARCLEFLILTAARSGEARGAHWNEINGDVWNVPGDRMKRGVEHRVPLSRQAKQILSSVESLDGNIVFPSRSLGVDGNARTQSDAVFAALLRRMDRQGFTIHGFRSGFRDWCSESAHAEREVAEAALSHAVGSQVERAYARSDLFDRRNLLMQRWADFVLPSLQP